MVRILLTDGGDADEPARRGKRRRRALVLGALAVVADGAVLPFRGYGLGGRVVVRCREGHLFTTIWIPAGSLKALRLGPWRLQRCPVGHHWSLVTPVARKSLDQAATKAAAAVRDLPVP